MKRCSIAAKIARLIAILPRCPLNDFFKYGYERFPDLWGPLLATIHVLYGKFGPRVQYTIDEFQINEINIDLRTSGVDNEVLSVDACAVW